MDSVNQDHLREKYKAEADDILFDGLQFDDRMKNVVLKRVHSTNDQPSNTVTERPRSRYKRWMYATAASAAAVIIVLSLPTIISNDRNQPIHTAEPPNSLFTATEEPNVMQPTFPPNDDIFITMVDKEPLLVEETLRQFGSGLVLPSHIAETFELQEETVVAYAEDGSVKRAEFQYVSGEMSYVFIADKEAAIESYMQLEEIEIDGAAAYIETPNDSYTELHWQTQDIVYSIKGNLSQDEAKRVASSIPN